MAAADVLIDAAQLLVLYIALIQVPNYILYIVEKRIIGRRLAKGIPSPLALEYGAEELLSSLVRSGIVAPFFEEGVFRGVPLLLAGFWGLVVGSLLWAIAHIANPLKRYRELLPTPVLLRYLPFFIALFCLPSTVFYVYAWSISPVWGYAFHAFHNVCTVLSEYVSVRMGMKRGANEFVGEAAPAKAAEAAPRAQSVELDFFEDFFVDECVSMEE